MKRFFLAGFSSAIFNSFKNVFGQSIAHITLHGVNNILATSIPFQVKHRYSREKTIAKLESD